MTFTSLPFILFLLTVFAVFTVIPARYRWIVLLVGSYFFYACFNAWYLLLVLAAVTAISNVCGALIYKNNCQKTKMYWMWTGVAANVLILVLIKYIPFIINNINSVLGLLSEKYELPSPHLLVSIGVSYFILQGISYLIDIYLEILEPEQHPGYFALSMCFFPKLLQGPIERSGNLLPQMQTYTIPSFETIRGGITLFLWGMFKKVVIADRISTYVDPVYNDVHAYSGLSLILATYLFAIQIYFDFSGYTDMALGTARLFNIRLTQNFNSPYLATSTADFWRRWHISFSSWILDYIFKPIQLSLRNWSPWGVPSALMVTFLISGIWHGASWCFIVWGGLHGIYLSVGTLFKKLRSKFIKTIGLENTRLLKYCQIAITFHLVCFAWIFFRAATITDALYVVQYSLLGIPQSLAAIGSDKSKFAKQLLMGKPEYDFMIIFGVVIFASVIGLWERRNKYPFGELMFLTRLPSSINGFFLGVVVYMIVFWGARSQSFIYLQF
ncbi:MAG: MBOAT family O-acyltransferase [Pedobacter sp.]